jgi:hypothetical protein
MLENKPSNLFFEHTAGQAAATFDGTLGTCKTLTSQGAGASLLVTSSASSVTMSIYVVALAVLAALVQILAL